ncbi:aminoglycoside phosphotransferase [Erythrobacter sp. QSSC1-22B]|uniref:phosphotransferase family protein n=1 Tax=Erythrobacter sp. QSSC1-22B TaxID=1860125 RepID=UPI0008052E7A|nr:phosphotransferase family protein [Erythrobacter sp. QSSC1-22B]OBX19459.1 aminoglycoside phosphotransferase [Erythrobacter sp. QSSC1-22B]
MTDEPIHSDLDAAALQSWIDGALGRSERIERIAKFTGGQSNPTYRIETAAGAMVLRRKPFGSLLPSAHAVEREYRLIDALHGTPVPVAAPLALCEDPDVIGSPFYLMKMVAGRTFWNGALPDCAPTERRAIYDAAIDALAALHAVDPQAVGLGDFGAPGNYFVRQVGRWTKQYRAAQTDDIPEIERLIEWLPETLPQQDRTSIIHGDYRIDNLIYAPDGPQILAIIDWELSTLGDPLADFAYLAMNWAMPHGERGAQLGGLDLPALGIPTLEEATERYCAATGRDSVPDLNWFFAYNLFRLVGIIQGIKKRTLDGNASSANAEAATSRIVPLARQAWAFAQKAQI